MFLPPVLFSKFYLILKYVFHNVVNLNKENISKGNNRRKTLFIPPCILIISWGRFVNSVWVRGLSRRQDTGPCSSYCDMLCFDFHSAIYVVRLCYTSKKCLLFAHSNSPVCLCKTKKKRKKIAEKTLSCPYTFIGVFVKNQSLFLGSCTL